MSQKFKERRRARFHAVQALYQQLLAHTNVNELKLQFYADNVERHPVEWNFFYRLLDGVDKNRFIINQKINHYAINDLASINPIDLAILCLGTYELIDCLDVPYQVVLNEYVDQAKELGTKEGHRFVNGLLQNIATEVRKEAIK